MKYLANYFRGKQLITSWYDTDPDKLSDMLGQEYGKIKWRCYDTRSMFWEGEINEQEKVTMQALADDMPEMYPAHVRGQGDE